MTQEIKNKIELDAFTESCDPETLLRFISLVESGDLWELLKKYAKDPDSIDVKDKEFIDTFLDSVSLKSVLESFSLRQIFKVLKDII